MPATLPLSHALSQQPGHILFVTGEYPPMPGGVGAYTAELAAALVGRGWQVSVLTSRGAQTPHAEPHPGPPQLGEGAVSSLTSTRLLPHPGGGWEGVNYQKALFPV